MKLKKGLQCPESPQKICISRKTTEKIVTIIDVSQHQCYQNNRYDRYDHSPVGFSQLRIFNYF